MPSPDRQAAPSGSGLVAITTTPAAYGGLEKVVSELARALHTRGRPVVVVVVLEPSTPEPDWVRDLIGAGLDLEVLRIRGRSYRAEFRAINRLIASRKVAVLHSHGYRADLIHAAAARRANVPTVSTVHGFTGRGMKGRLYERLQCLSLRAFDAVVAVSRPLVLALESSGVAAARIRLLPNALSFSGTDHLTRAEARRRLELPAVGPVVGWVGRMSPEKGPDVMVRALASLPGDTALCMVGDGPELGETRSLAESLGLAARIRFAGAVPGAGAFFPAFDVLALSSRTEGTPMVALEAAAAGVPVVATSVGGVPELLGASGGLLVPPDNPVALAEALRCSLRDREVARGRASVLLDRLRREHDAAEWAARYDRLYDELTAR